MSKPDIVRGSALVGGADARSVYQGDPSARSIAGTAEGRGPSMGGMAWVGEKPVCPSVTKKGLPCKGVVTSTGYCMGHSNQLESRKEEK